MTKWLPWLIALIAGGAAAVLASRHINMRISNAEALLAREFVLRPVIVAARAIPAGQALQVEDLALRKMPARYAPSEARGAEASAEFLGRMTLHALAPGDPVLPSSLQSSGLPALASLVGADRRAITLAVDEINGFAGLLAPGDVVDLVYIADGDAANPRAAAVRPLLEAVTVIATGRSTRRTRTTGGDGVARDIDVDYATVALDVAPVDAQRLVLAQRTGEITVLLRGPDSRGTAALRVVDVSTITGPARHTRALRAPAVQLIVGGAAAQPVVTLEAPST
jgi:pilus assembly protein CpaB